VGKKLEFFFDIVSPASYLAWTQMPKLAAETGAEIVYRPFFLPGLFKAAGSSSPISVPAKGKWMLADLSRFAVRYGVPFRLNAKFPLNSVTMMRGLIHFRGKPQLRTLGDALYAAMWADNRDVTDPAELGRIAEEAGIAAAEFARAVADPANKQALFDATNEAAGRGAFGAPTFFVDGEMHWGQDRLDFVREALLR
jgi:2-hydroxychromene-2-carboxylate isomerase